MSERYGDLTVGGFLDALAARSPAPSGGAAAAVTVASAAALTAMAARFAGSAELTGLAGPADVLRARLLELADADGPAYAQVLAASRLPASAPDRAARMAAAFRTATEVPLAVARAGVEVAELAARLVAEGNANLVGDSRVAVLLAEAGVRAAAELVGINVRHGELDGAPLADARACVRTAEAFARPH
ncbi:MAG TPA: cyclodeaminase/cyclohydrolase family protein [Pseudonocardia sp.]|uniref:cyclodeaminase/cyclohydrolase family protein n=1 Tax=Pseudonocardia sp. TaxID=60912 RepID=UPI002B7A8343|nr:cyclodeaminase/cyclohydrolase family protein [Pseudonocardia sp.]HTF49196.1 cyclodeaminase/cyclohydrolase family protein [Pseudonocardia sp.]